MMSALCKSLAAAVLICMSSLSYAGGYYRDYRNDDYRVECRPVYNHYTGSVRHECFRVYIEDRPYRGSRWPRDFGDYSRDGYCCVWGYRPNPYYDNRRWRERPRVELRFNF